MAVQITPSLLQSTYTNFDLRFQQGRTRAKIFHPRIATTVPSTAGSNTYAWMKSIRGYRKWIGERVFQTLVSKATVLVNDDYENSVEVPRNAIEDEQLGLFGFNVQMMGEEAARWPDKLVAAAIKAGTTTVHYDGQPFFHNSHPIDPDDASKGVYSNNYTGMALTPDNYGTVTADFASRLNEAGEPMGLVSDLLIVPPQLRDAGKRIVETDLLARAIAGTAAPDRNIYQNTAELLVLPDLADEPTTWYVGCFSLPLKPFIFQERQAPRMFTKTSPDDANVLYEKVYRYLSDARGSAGYTFPFMISRAQA